MVKRGAAESVVRSYVAHGIQRRDQTWGIGCSGLTARRKQVKRDKAFAGPPLLDSADNGTI
jgi:hypothetical protein